MRNNKARGVAQHTILKQVPLRASMELTCVLSFLDRHRDRDGDGD